MHAPSFHFISGILFQFSAMSTDFSFLLFPSLFPASLFACGFLLLLSFFLWHFSSSSSSSSWSWTARTFHSNPIPRLQQFFRPSRRASVSSQSPSALAATAAATATAARCRFLPSLLLGPLRRLPAERPVRQPRRAAQFFYLWFGWLGSLSLSPSLSTWLFWTGSVPRCSLRFGRYLSLSLSFSLSLSYADCTPCKQR
jgi:hypothetical protein